MRLIIKSFVDSREGVFTNSLDLLLFMVIFCRSPKNIQISKVLVGMEAYKCSLSVKLFLIQRLSFPDLRFIVI